jgi:hypothetical protein
MCTQPYVLAQAGLQCHRQSVVTEKVLFRKLREESTGTWGLKMGCRKANRSPENSTADESENAEERVNFEAVRCGNAQYAIERGSVSHGGATRQEGEDGILLLQKVSQGFGENVIQDLGKQIKIERQEDLQGNPSHHPRSQQCRWHSADRHGPDQNVSS